jgi:hypothetical protein
MEAAVAEVCAVDVFLIKDLDLERERERERDFEIR